jgi:hypothetical protein
MARVMPMPVTVWKTSEPVTVAAHGKVVRKYEVPATFAAQINEARKPVAQKAKGPMLSATRTTFGVHFAVPQAAAAQAPAAQAQAPQLAKAF